MRRHVLGLLVAVVALTATAGGSGARGAMSHEGGTFRIAFLTGGLDSLDPALSYSAQGWALLDTTCLRLLTYPDKNPPEGFRLVPEAAAAYPKVSRDSRTFTFTIGRGFRFSDGSPVDASAFANAINRTLAHDVNSAGAQYTSSIIGAAAVRAGKATSASGVVARGNRLTIRFTHAVPDFPAQTTMPFFCAVPPKLPPDSEGIAVFPAAGPYRVTDYRPGASVVLERNPFYGGKRPHHVDRFEVDLQAASSDEVLDRIERGDSDWGFADPPLYYSPGRRLVGKYGVNRSQFFLKPGLVFKAFAFNNSRPLFHGNARLRRAVNFAIDRAALRNAAGGPLLSTLTDHYLPPALPGFEHARIYPLAHGNVAKARALARGSTRRGRATLLTLDLPAPLAVAQIFKRDLARIGLRVTIRALPRAAYATRVGARNSPFDIAFVLWRSDYLDPYSYLNLLLDSRFIGGTNFALFESPTYDRRLRAASVLRGAQRYRAYGRLDVELARDEAPMAATEYVNEPTLVSTRVGCIVLRPSLDLTAACLK